jgi:aspartyl-tRNA synthetase
MTEFLKGKKRTHKCGEFTKKHVGQEVLIMGWVASKRDFGDLSFTYIRDVSGEVQVVFNALKSQELSEKANTLKYEYVVAIKGTVILRDEANIKKSNCTGEIEIEASQLIILSESEVLPFMLEGKNIGNENQRLEHRYLDIRRQEIKNNLILRANISKSIRHFLEDESFIEVETPILGKSTPEGARDYLVPSRVNKGSFYALPQSPQLYKQLLMIGGLDRYYQIAKCFRDEDLRADRQPEFTQVDIEMSFVDDEDTIIKMNELLMKKVFKDNLGMDLLTPFPRMNYEEAMNSYGSDKPDLRFGFKIEDLSDIVEDGEFEVFTNAIKGGGSVKAINAKGLNSSISRKYLDKLTSTAKLFKARGLASIRMTEEGINSSLTKVLEPEELEVIVERMGLETGDMLLIVSDSNNTTACRALGAIRLKLAEKFELIDKDSYHFSWVVDFPMFEYNEEDERYYAQHHPFTAPKDEDLHLLESEPGKVRAKAYDMIINGQEVGGGSIRISNQDLQEKVFKVLNFTAEEIKEQFGFFVDAFKYGAPPHGGIAYGLDRLVMLLAKTENIKDVVAFPKIQNASSLMSKAPSVISEAQLEELALKIVIKEEY